MRENSANLSLELAVVDATPLKTAPFELPGDWTVKKVPRPDGVREDKYYYEPGTGRKFLSLKAVKRHLTGAETPSPEASKLGDRYGIYYERGARRKVKPLRFSESHVTVTEADDRPSPKASKLSNDAKSSRVRKSIVCGGRLLKLDNEEFDPQQLIAVPSHTEAAASTFILPDGWVVEEVPRLNPPQKYKTFIDKCYYEPGTGRRFLSLVSVKRHLEELEEAKPLALMFNLGGHDKKLGSRKKNSKEKVKTSASEPAMPPAKIKWVLCESAFKPSIGEAAVADTVIERWANIFTLSVKGENITAPSFE